MITRGMPGHRLGYRRADRLSVQLHLIRDPCMPAKYQETRDQKNCQDDQPEVAPPASILDEAIPKFNALIIRVWPGAAQSATGPTNMPPVATPEGLARNADRRLKGGRRLSAPVQQREGEQSQSINRRRDQ